jgi:hypothetical protein
MAHGKLNSVLRPYLSMLGQVNSVNTIGGSPTHGAAIGLWGVIAEGLFARDIGLFYDNVSILP